jgi:hypothetical protein
VQGVVSIPGARTGITVEEVTEKRREIPPNAAPKGLIESVLRRATEVDVDIHEAAKRAGLGRATGYRILDGTASLASVRKVDEWLVKQERKAKVPTIGNGEERDARLAEWNELGEKLLGIDPARFADALEGVRDMVEAVEKMQGAIRKMFRATPDAPG